MQIYEISNTYADLVLAIENGEIPEEAIADTLAAIEGEFGEAAESLAIAIKTAAYEEKALAEEIKVLQGRKAAKAAVQEKFKGYLLQEMLAIGKTKIETSKVVISIASNPPSVKFADELKFKEWALKSGKDYFLRISEPQIAKTAVMEALKAGEVVPGAEIAKTKGVRIK